MLTIPSPHTKVRIAIDGMPLETVQVGMSEVYDEVDAQRNVSSEFVASDSAGYLDLVAEHSLEPGVHDVSYKVRSRKPVKANLFIKVLDHHVEAAKHNLKGSAIVVAGGYGVGSKLRLRTDRLILPDGSSMDILSCIP